MPTTLACLGNAQCMLTVDHRFALSNPALLSEPSKKLVVDPIGDHSPGSVRQFSRDGKDYAYIRIWTFNVDVDSRRFVNEFCASSNCRTCQRMV
jgi:hypothetical protein